MKAISIWQPHAWLFGRGKEYETRAYPVPGGYRGPIAIHASKTIEECKDVEEIIARFKGVAWPEQGYNFSRTFHQVFGEHIKQNAIPTKGLRLENFLAFGAVVAIGELTACYDAPKLWGKLASPSREFGDFGQGRYAWRIESVQILKTAYPLRGQQKLWDLPPHIVNDLNSAETE